MKSFLISSAMFWLILNLAPKLLDYKIGIDTGTHWEVVFNSDDDKYSGSGIKPDIWDENTKSGWGIRNQ